MIVPLDHEKDIIKTVKRGGSYSERPDCELRKCIERITLCSLEDINDRTVLYWVSGVFYKYCPQYYKENILLDLFKFSDIIHVRSAIEYMCLNIINLQVKKRDAETGELVTLIELD